MEIETRCEQDPPGCKFADFGAMEIFRGKRVLIDLQLLSLGKNIYEEDCLSHIRVPLETGGN